VILVQKGMDGYRRLGVQDERSDSELFAMPLDNGALGGSDGSGVDIFIESGDCDLESAAHSGA